MPRCTKFNIVHNQVTKSRFEKTKSKNTGESGESEKLQSYLVERRVLEFVLDLMAEEPEKVVIEG